MKNIFGVNENWIMQNSISILATVTGRYTHWLQCVSQQDNNDMYGKSNWIIINILRIWLTTWICGDDITKKLLFKYSFTANLEGARLFVE